MKKLFILPFLLLLAACGGDDNLDNPTPNPADRPDNVKFVVAQDGTGDFTTVQQAIDAIPSNSKSRQIIYIKAGTYKEKLAVPQSKTFVTLIGENAASTILTYDDSSGTKLPS
ncbi:MAG: hypothetical protein IIU62_00315, partial [Alistipes sp.]|nr:hypothetical protein [Alistipes sp.]